MNEMTPSMNQNLLHAGEKLARQRQVLGIEVAKAAAHLRISARQIEAIEGGRWEEFPNPAILRGFVRAYAKFMQLPPDHLLDELPQVKQAPDDLAYTPSVCLALPGQGPHFVRRRQWWWWIPVLCAALVLAALELMYPQWWQVFKGRTNFSQLEINQLATQEKKSSVLTQSVPSSATSQAVVTTSSTTAATVQNIASENVIPAQTQSPVMVLNFTQESWVEIAQADNLVLARGLQAAGSRLQLDGKAPFYLLLGNASQVQLNYQGLPIDLTRYTNTNNQVARLTLK